MDFVIYGQARQPRPCARRPERLDARRVYLIVSRTLNTKTDEIEKIRKALGDRLMPRPSTASPQHTTPRSGGADGEARQRGRRRSSSFAIGGGSVVDAAKIVLMCMEHEIFDQSGLDGYETTPEAPLRPVPHTKSADDRDPPATPVRRRV